MSWIQSLKHLNVFSFCNTLVKSDLIKSGYSQFKLKLKPQIQSLQKIKPTLHVCLDNSN